MKVYAQNSMLYKANTLCLPNMQKDIAESQTQASEWSSQLSLDGQLYVLLNNAAKLALLLLLQLTGL